MRAWWESEDEIAHPGHPERGPKLLIQKGVYHYENGSTEAGLRFAWTFDGRIEPGPPTRIDSLDDIAVLTELARRKGW